MASFHSFLRTAAGCVLVALAGLVAPRALAQQQFQGVCANVKIVIAQELAIERIGFEATLEITNNVGGDPLTDFNAQLTFTASDEVDANGVKVDASDRFFVQAPRLDGINAVDGTGVIGPTKTAVIKWFIIPKRGAGGTSPLGRHYEVGCEMSAKIAGEPVPRSVLFAIPDTITVKPDPELDITYFQPRDVQGDDPFTPEVESPIPFTLGVLVTNSGYGPARSLTIDSQQPKIVENRAGLLLVARLLGSRVQDSLLDESSLKVDLGDIQPGETKKGAWDMITSLSGEFIEFKASYTHSAELGGEETSVIKSLNAYFFAHEVLNDDPGRDNILDFLADTDRDDAMIPDTLYESQGPVLPVNHWPDAAVTTPLSGRTFTVTVNADTEGFGYVRLDDPGQAKYAFESVVRQDGKVINLHNVWTNIRYRQTDNAKLTYFNLMDKVTAPGTNTYTVTYAPPPVDTTPPDTRLRFVGQVTTADGNYYVTRDTQMYFTSDDDSPVSIVYNLDGGADKPGIPFTLSDPGTYIVRYHATDFAGNVETEKTATLVLQADGPAISNVDLASGSLALTGDALTFRSNQINLGVTVSSNPVPVDVVADVFRGIRSFPTLSGVPVSPTPSTVTTLVVGGDQVDFYRYRLGSGAWSAEFPVSTPLTLSDLGGTVTLSVEGRSQHGGFPTDDSEALAVTWVVDAAAPPFALTGFPVTPTRSQVGPMTVIAPGVDLFRWNPNNTYFRAQAAPGTSITVPVQSPGTQTIALTAHRNGTWTPDAEATIATWQYDPTYGSDYSALTKVYTQSFTDVEGSTFNFAWDGRSNGGTLQTPGWYTVRLRVQDDVGHISYRSVLVQIEELVATPEALTTSDQGAEKPNARGGWLVWQERGSGTPNVFALHVGVPDAVATQITDSALNQENPRTDGRYVVWQSRQENGNWDVMMVDLTQGEPVVTRITSTATRDETNPVIDWPWIVWQSKDLATPNAPWQLEAKNMETMQQFVVDPTTSDQLDPAVQAGRVVWQDFRDVGYGEIYYRDLESGLQRRLTINEGGQYAPDIDGHWVVWQDNRNTQVDVYGYDLRMSQETRLTNTTANEGRPRLVGSWLLFSDDSVGSLTDNYSLFDLGTRGAVPLTRSATAKSFGSIAGGRLFWQAGASGSSTLESASVPAVQPVFKNYNAVALSPELVGKYGSAYALLAAWSTEAGVTSISHFTSLAPLAVESASMDGGSPMGTDFTLNAGEFVWVQFSATHLVDLGTTPTATVDLPAGTSAFSYTAFPLGYTAHQLVLSLGIANVHSVRLLDAQTGQWRVLVVQDGAIVGADFRVPSVAVVLLDLVNPVSAWKP